MTRRAAALALYSTSQVIDAPDSTGARRARGRQRGGATAEASLL